MRLKLNAFRTKNEVLKIQETRVKFINDIFYMTIDIECMTKQV